MTGGGSGGQQASPPKLDVAGSLKLSQGQIDQLIRNAPEVSRVLGNVGRTNAAQDTIFGLNMLTDPNATLRGAARKDGLAKARKQRDGQIKDLRQDFRSGKITEQQFDRRTQQARAAYRQDAREVRQDVRGMRPLQELQRTFAPEFAARDRLLGDIDRARASSPEYLRAQEAMAAGLGRGELGESLYQTALTRAQSQGQLTPEAERDAVQAARSGMAARGMATGNAALGAELLNRDRYSRARMAEDLAFAGGVQANEQARQQFNIGLLGQSSQMADAERGRQLGLGQDAYNFRLSTNPRMMLAGVGSPYANLQVPGLQQLGGIVGSVEPQYSGGQFSSGNQGMNMLAGGLGGALSGAAAGTMVNPGLGTAIGGALGLGAGLLGSYR